MWFTFRAPIIAPIVLGLSLAAIPSAGMARECGSGSGGFGSWLSQFKAKAAAQGISAGTIASALGGVAYDPRVIRLDRSQHSFKLSFEAFYARRAGGALIGRGRARMRAHRGTLDRIEKQFGVPAAVVVAIWGLETNYGADTSGRFSILRSLATLAYDCRRSPFFTGQLVDALRIVEGGDMTPSQLRGGWAGEIGQTQFLPTPYVRYAVDFDGDGRRNLVSSIPDVLASNGQLPQGPRMAGRTVLGAGIGQLRGHQGVEQGRGLPAHHRGDVGEDARLLIGALPRFVLLARDVARAAASPHLRDQDGVCSRRPG